MAGYNWYYGKSNNAVDAEYEGKFTISNVFKENFRHYCETNNVETIKYMSFTSKYLKEFIRDWVNPCEYHHTSKYFNETYYYKWEDVLEALEEAEIFEQPKKERKKKERKNVNN